MFLDAHCPGSTETRIVTRQMEVKVRTKDAIEDCLGRNGTRHQGQHTCYSQNIDLKPSITESVSYCNSSERESLFPVSGRGTLTHEVYASLYVDRRLFDHDRIREFSAQPFTVHQHQRFHCIKCYVSCDVTSSLGFYKK